MNFEYGIWKNPETGEYVPTHTVTVKPEDYPNTRANISRLSIDEITDMVIKKMEK